jgi:hypothetical protein
MKAAEILRKLADIVDSAEQDRGSDTLEQPSADFSSNRTQQRLDVVKPSEPELDDNPVMVPPLQAKLEILKKSEGIPNVYDEEGGEGTDELAMIKKNAGITTAQQEASDDEPLDQ